jgi:hypothetical protein
MAYFYHFELILAGIILLSAMGFAGVKLWLKRKESNQTNSIKNDESNSANTQQF